MIREDGVVVEVLDAQTVRIAMDAAGNPRCESCGICRRDPGANCVLLDVRTAAQLKVGDRVTVEIPAPGAAVSGLLLMLVPLVLFIAGILLGDSLRERGILPGGTWVSVLLGLGLMTLAYLLAAVYDRHLRRSPEHQPKIVDWPRHG